MVREGVGVGGGDAWVEGERVWGEEIRLFPLFLFFLIFRFLFLSSPFLASLRRLLSHPHTPHAHILSPSNSSTSSLF